MLKCVTQHHLAQADGLVLGDAQQDANGVRVVLHLAHEAQRPVLMLLRQLAQIAPDVCRGAILRLPRLMASGRAM